MKEDTLQKLQNRIHQQNKEMGLWDEPRSRATLVNLFHSELSEAVEGLRKNLMDDHLPEYPMWQVEIADFVIRVLDYLGSENFQWDLSQLNDDSVSVEDEMTLIAQMHDGVSCFFSSFYSSGYSDDVDLAEDAWNCFCYFDRKEIPLLKIIEEKVAYNRTRADHKPENRAKEGGKKF